MNEKYSDLIYIGIWTGLVKNEAEVHIKAEQTNVWLTCFEKQIYSNTGGQLVRV